MPETSSSRAAWKRPLLIGLAVAAVAAAVWMSPLRAYVDPAGTAARLKAAGDLWWAPLLFIALYSAFNVFLIPATILSLTAGVVWGWLAGGLWVLAASTIGSFFPYAIGRSVGEGWAGRMIERRAAGIYHRLQDEGFMTMLLMRLVPIVPYNVLNYAAGIAGIGARDYISATFVGTIPAIFIFTYLADSIAAGVISPRAAFLRVVLAGLLLAALAVSTRILAGRVRRRIG